jgi:hypothetical protein
MGQSRPGPPIPPHGMVAWGPWYFMDGYHWISMETPGYTWISMHIHDINGNPWIPVDINGSIAFNDILGYPWISTVLHNMLT